MIDKDKPIDRAKLKLHIENQEANLIRRQQYVDAMDHHHPDRENYQERIEELKKSIVDHKDLLKSL